MRGSAVLRDINSNVDTAQAEFDRIGADLGRVHADLENARSEESRQLASLARIRLEQLAGNKVAGGLDAADRQALEVLEQRRVALDELRQRIAASAAKQRELEAERDRARDAVDQSRDAHDDRAEETLRRLGETEVYESQRNHVERATSQAAHASEKATQAETDRERKRQPYENDKLFMYLWKRRYRFPEYRAFPLFRTLDGWVAGLCDYLKAHRDYGMLLALPDRLREHANRLVDAAAVEAEALAKLEQAAYEADGLPALAKVLADARVQFESNEDEIEAEEAMHAGLLEERAAAEAGTDPHSRDALLLLTQQIQHEDVATLQADARGTGTPEDDAVVGAIDNLRKRQRELESQVDELRADQDRALEALERVQDLRRRFRQRGYDSRDSLFDSDFSIAGVLGGLLEGAVGVGSVWSTINRAQRFRRRASSSASNTAFSVLGGLFSSSAGSSSSSSSSSSFGGGGSSFGGFGGGGGFSSGGGFGGGGGGGFSTGGGF